MLQLGVDASHIDFQPFPEVEKVGGGVAAANSTEHPELPGPMHQLDQQLLS